MVFKIFFYFFKKLLSYSTRVPNFKSIAVLYLKKSRLHEQLQSQIMSVGLGLTNFEIQKYYQREHQFNSVYLRNNLPKK